LLIFAGICSKDAIAPWIWATTRRRETAGGQPARRQKISNFFRYQSPWVVV
jgi:hypothetical protein